MAKINTGGRFLFGGSQKISAPIDLREPDAIPSSRSAWNMFILCRDPEKSGSYVSSEKRAAVLEIAKTGTAAPATQWRMESNGGRPKERQRDEQQTNPIK